MFKKLISYILISILSINAFAIDDVPVAASFQRIYNTPLDTTIVFTNYDEAVNYAVRGASTNSTAYKGQYIAVPTNGVYFIDDNWQLQEIGGKMTFFAGESVDSMETNSTPMMYIKMDYDPDHYYTSFTTLTNNDGEFPTLLIPMRGQKGADGAANLLFDGWWDKTKAYETTNTVVSYLGTSYINVKPVPSETEITDDEYWKVFVAQGNPGSNGIAAVIRSVSASSVDYTQTADVINTGTESEAEFVFYIPRGEPGVEGPPGADLTFASQWDSGSTPYAAKSLVRYGTNLWYTLTETSGEPGVSTDWKLFLSDGEKGNDGPRGLTMRPNITEIQMLDPTETPSTDFIDITDTTNVNYRLNIPRGERGPSGVDAIYYGEWSSSYGSNYPEKSMVHHGTNVWYTDTEVSPTVEPGSSSSPWIVFMSDGSQGLPGDPGDTIIPFAYATNVSHDYSEVLVTNQLIGLTNYFYFKIPEGKPGDPGDQGPPGAGLVFLGAFNPNPTTPYASNSLVRYGTNLWFAKKDNPSGTPGSSYDWTVFISDGEKGSPGNPGQPGDTIIPFAFATNVPYGTTNNLVTNQLVGLTNYFYFGIPEGKQGPAGVDLAFYGNFDTNVLFEYPTNSLVRFGTNVWFTEVETTSTPGTDDDWSVFLSDGRPAHVFVNTNVDKLTPSQKPYITTNAVEGNEQDVEITFHIPQGVKGDTGTIEVGAVNTGDPGTDVIINNSGSPTAAKFDFTIPRGYPGAGLAYNGQYLDGHFYPSNSLVRVNSDLWYADVDTSQTPSSSASDWSEFLTTTRFNILTNGTPLEPSEIPQVTSSYDETNNIITMQFSIPRGVQGLTKSPVPNLVTNVPTRIIEGVEFPGQATVTLSTNQPDPAYISFDFGIPVGITGAQGPTGASGTNATITVGGVTNVPPTETNTLGEATFNVVPGEDNSYAFYFGIPAGITGEKGDKGDKGATLVPMGSYNATNVYYSNDLVRFETAQYYVIDDNDGQGISGISPTNGLEYWSMFVQDGQGIAVNATTLFNFDNQDDPIYHTGNILLDTNTLVVISTNLNDTQYNALTVVGGVGGGAVKQWEIDYWGGMMPAEEMYAGAWGYDERGDLMPPLEEDDQEPPPSIVRMPTRVITSTNDYVTTSDYIIWMDSEAAGGNQVLNLIDLPDDSHTVIVRHLGDFSNTIIQRGEKQYILAGDGTALAIDWLGSRQQWYWRQAY